MTLAFDPMAARAAVDADRNSLANTAPGRAPGPDLTDAFILNDDLAASTADGFASCECSAVSCGSSNCAH